MIITKIFAFTVTIAIFSVSSGMALAAGGGGVLTDPGAMEGKHFHPKGKMPSKFTVQKQNNLRQTMPFDDKRDFEEQKKGFIAAPDFKQIMADAGHVAWDMGSYEWLLQGKEFDSIHPSLQRQAILNMNYGLYEVVPGIYQVRGFDLANISFIKSETGWIVFDPLTAKETAKAALDFVNEKLGKRPVVAVVYSHSHADHFGGVLGVTTREALAAGEGHDRHAVGDAIAWFDPRGLDEAATGRRSRCNPS